MANFKLTGTVKEIRDTNTFKSGFQKRGIIVHDKNKKFDGDFEVFLLKDDCSKADALKPGMECQFDLWVECRGWQPDSQTAMKYFVSLTIDSFEILGEPQPAQTSTTAPTNIDADVPF